MSSFDEFYKKWKKQKGITTDSNYRNLSDTQKVESANTTINDFMQKYQNKLQENTQNTAYKQSSSDNKSLWDKINDTMGDLGYNLKNIALGGKRGFAQMFKGTETQLESNSNYKKQKEEQFLTGTKISDFAKAEVKSDNLLNKKINVSENQGTILDKSLLLKADNSEIKDELGKYKNSISEGKIDVNLMRNSLQKEIDKTSKEIQGNIDNVNNPILKKTAELAPSIGQMGVGMVASSINPAIGTLYFTESAVGSYYDDAKQRGMNDSEARKYSAIMGAMEGATEMIGIENLSKAGKGVKALVKGTGKEVLKEGTEQITKTTLKTVLKDYGIGIADNVIQEALIDPIQEFTAQTVAGKDKAQWDGIGQKMLQDGINGGLVSAILGGANLGIQSCTGVIQKMNNNQEVTQQELQTAVQDASKQLNVEQMITDSTQQQINKYKDYYTGKNLDNNAQNILNQAQNIINNNSTQNLQQNTTQNQINQQNQQTISAQDKNISNLNMTTPIAEKQVKSIIKDFNESAKQYNIDFNNEDLQEINQMFNKRGIKAYFDENTFKNNNDAFSVWKPVIDEQGNVSGREVVFNPKAKDSKVRVQELAIHELGHDLDLNEVQNMILKDASRKNNWESARKSLESTYREAYKNDGINISEEEFNKIVDEEATMSILQRELGSQEYVNRLVNQNQSIAKKIYNWVIDKLNKFTGGKNEKIFWKDVKNKFETAYNQEFNKNENNFKYSVGGKEGLKNIIDPNERAEGFKNYKLAKQMAKKGKTNNEIFAKTGWFQDKVTGEMKFNFSDKDMDVIPKNYKIGQEYTLKEILKHDTLFEMYPQLKEYTVVIEDMNANKDKKTIRGAYNRYTDVIKLDYRRFNKKADVEGTLIHEIQHAIQKIENFSRGASKVWGEKFYEKNPGEIEARDTSNRLMEEKYSGKDLNNVMPKSGNIEVSILDKMKIGLYNYLKDKKGGVEKSEDISNNQRKNTQDNSENNGLVLGGINQEDLKESENNSGSFNLQDNQGRKLSRQQQEFFKDSKVRDEKR